MKYAFFIYFSLIIFPLSGQKSSDVQNIQININESKTFNLSEIAEEIQFVELEMTQTNQFTYISNVLWTDAYLFVHAVEKSIDKTNSLSKVMQFDHSGKLIRIIAEGENLKNLMCDSIKQLLFIAIGNDVHSYDFDGKLKKQYTLKKNPVFYYNDYFYALKSEFKQDGASYFLTSYNIQTEKEEILFKYKEELDMKNTNTIITRQAGFSLHNNIPIVSLGPDNTIYRIEKDKLTPIVNFTFKPAKGDKSEPWFQGFIGNYLCIHYQANRQVCLYLKNQRTGKVFQTESSYTNGVKDDLLETGYCSIKYINRSGYFYFTKGKYDFNNSKLNIPEEKAPQLIFFVKLKQ